MTFNIFTIAALAGTGIILAGILIPAVIYRGKNRERYSVFNHYISELGELGVSRAARIFNLGLICGGLILAPYILWMGTLFESPLGWLGAGAGVVAVLSVAAVGIFPMNYSAMTFFRSGLAMILITGLAIQFQPAGRVIVPKSANILSVLAGISYVTFLILLARPGKDDNEDHNPDPGNEPSRQRFIFLPFLEWLVFFSTISWLFGVVFFL
jgi:hypothetical membrane protein